MSQSILENTIFITESNWQGKEDILLGFHRELTAE